MEFGSFAPLSAGQSVSSLPAMPSRVGIHCSAVLLLGQGIKEVVELTIVRTSVRPDMRDWRSDRDSTRTTTFCWLWL